MKDNTDLIEAYLNNELLGDDLLNFENRLNTEVDFVEEVTLHRQIRGFVKENEVENLKGQVKNWLAADESENGTSETENIILNPQKPKSVFSINLITRIAAGLVIIAGLSWYFFTNNSSQSAENQYYAELINQNPSQLQGADDRAVWAQAYREKNYKKTIAVLQVKKNPTPEESYYLGLALSANNQLEKAISQLSQNQIVESVYSEKAEWAKALIYLKLYKKSEAKLMLKKIENSDSEFSDKARMIDL
jgi:hypothetical protein